MPLRWTGRVKAVTEDTFSAQFDDPHGLLLVVFNKRAIAHSKQHRLTIGARIEWEITGIGEERVSFLDAQTKVQTGLVPPAKVDIDGWLED